MKKYLRYISLLLAFLTIAAYGELSPDGLYSVEGLWHLNDNGTESDASGNGNSATVNGATFTNSGKFGGAYSLDGNNDYLSVSDNPDLDMGTGDFTLLTWAKHGTSLGENNSMIAKGDYPYATEYSFTVVDSGELALFLFENGSNYYLEMSIGTYDDDTWHLFISVIDRSSGILFYVDGDFVASTTSYDVGDGINCNVDNSSPLDFGRSNRGGDFVPVYLEGEFDEIAIFDRALTAAEIKQIYAMQQGYGVQ